jgi:hypothetical protein
MSADKYTSYAEAALAERGITQPSNELLRLELVHIHLQEAACLAALIGQHELERGINFHVERVRIMSRQVELGSKIVP